MRRLGRNLAIPAAALALLLTACGEPAEESATTAAGGNAATDCTKDRLALKADGKLTIGTDSPAFEPWFSEDTPSNGKGFESAVASAVAKELGFQTADVEWKVVPFNNAFAPGAKDFDFDINQVSITDERRQAVDFSRGYYDVNQAIVAFGDSPAVNATTTADLQGLKLGAQVGTTSLDYITENIKPTAQPLVYNDNAGAKSALEAKQIDAIVLDLPTAFYVSAVEIEGTKVVGQFPPVEGGEQFGLVLEKGSKLTACVDKALQTLEQRGDLAKLQEQWLSTTTNAPVIKPAG